MTVLTKRAIEVFAPTTAAGQLRGADMAESMVWGSEIERGMDGAAAGRVDQATWAGLAAIAGTRAGQPAIVYGPDGGTHVDPVTGSTVQNVGEYFWSAAPAGWRRAGNLQRTLVHALNTGAGTANAVQATPDVQFSQSAYAALITVNFAATNTGPMTLYITGTVGTLPLVLNTGMPIPAGYVQAGMSALVQIDSGGNYRLFSYGDASAIQAVVEAIYADFRTQYLGRYLSNPATDPAGDAVQQGAFYWNTTSKAWFYWDGDSWEGFPFVAPADGAVTQQKLGANINDRTNQIIRLGENVWPDREPATGTNPIFTAKGIVAIGDNILTGVDKNATVSTFIGSRVAENANNLYGCDFMGFRTGDSVTDGLYLTILGIDAGNSLTHGHNSVLIGPHCANSKTTIDGSTLIGSGAGYAEGTVSDSVIIGSGACDNVQEAGAKAVSNSVVIGNFAARRMSTPSNIGNTVIGWDAMLGVNGATTGEGNTIAGSKAGWGITTGANNLVAGKEAGISLQNGHNNTILGATADLSGGTAWTESTALGYASRITKNYQISLGHASISELRCAVTTITAISDQREKRKAGDKDGRLPFDALALINGVTVRWFTWKMRDGSKTTFVPEAGIFAQELDALQERLGVDLGLVDKSNPKQLAATPGKLLFPLIEAVQQLTAANDNIRLTQESLDHQMAVANDNFTSIFGRLDEHDAEIAALKAEIAALKAA